MNENKFANGLPVISFARKVIFAVPQSSAPATFPEGCTISEYGQENGHPLIVVHNHIDIKDDPQGTWQGANTNGVIIMNNVPEQVALELLDMVELDHSIEGLQKMLSRAEELGARDNYTTSKEFVETKLTPAGKMLGQFTGIVKRDDRDVALVIRDENGTIWRKLGDGVNHIDTDEILIRDYRNKDGSTIDPASIPKVVATEEAA